MNFFNFGFTVILMYPKFIRYIVVRIYKKYTIFFATLLKIAWKCIKLKTTCCRINDKVGRWELRSTLWPKDIF